MVSVLFDVVSVFRGAEDLHLGLFLMTPRERAEALFEFVDADPAYRSMRESLVSYVADAITAAVEDSRTVSDIHDRDFDAVRKELLDAGRAHDDGAGAAVKELLGDLDAAVRECDEARAEYKALHKEAHAAHDVIAQRDRMIDAMTNRAQELALQKMDADRRIAELEAERDQAKRDADWYRGHVDRMSREQETIMTARLACENMRKRAEKAEMALRAIGDLVPCRGDHGGDCAYCGGIAAMDVMDKHEDDCPWKVARAALSAPAQPATDDEQCFNGNHPSTNGRCDVDGGSKDAAPPSHAAKVNDGYFTCPVCKGIGSHGDECQWLQEHYPAAATLGDELRKHERYLNREISYDERHAPAAREATGFAGIFGKWPGDETDEQIEAALKDDSAVISSNRNSDEAERLETARRALIDARATIKIADETPYAFTYEQAQKTLARIDGGLEALAALDAARSKETK